MAMVFSFISVLFSLHLVPLHGFEAKAWQNIGPDTLNMEFPEETYEDIMARPNVGLSFSGGGDRAFISSIGVLGALHELGLIDKMRYIVGVSGGSWATAVYTYYQKHNVSDATMLGEIVFPQDIIYSELNVIDDDCVRKYPNSTYVLTGPFYEDWVDAVQAIYLTPSGINKGVPVSYNEDSVADIKSRNPSLANTEFIMPRGTIEKTGTDKRPFPIISTTLIGPEDLLPYTPENRNYTLLEFTPLSVGVVKSATVHYESTERFGGEVSQTVGGLVEPFAFGGSFAPVNGLATGVTSGTLSVPDSALVADVGMAAASSSWAVGCSVAASDNALSQAAVGKLNYYAPSAEHPADDFDVFLLGDGAGVSNTNIISLLQRNVYSIIAVVSTSVPLQNSTHWDPTSDALSTENVDFTMPAWFGHIAEDLSDISKVSYDLENSQAFEEVEWAPLAQALQAAQARGTGNVVAMEHTTVYNKKYGIEAGRKVNVVWVYLGRCTAWEQMLSEDMYHRLVPAQDSANQANVIEEGEFRNFPHYITSLATNNVRRANVLADLMGWVIYQNLDILENAIEDHSHTHNGTDDDSTIFSSTMIGIVVSVIVLVVLVLVLAMAARKGRGEHSGEKSIERKSEMTTSPVHDTL